MSIAISELNIWAILVATAITMVVGSLWYSPLLFGNVWMKLVKLDPNNMRGAAGPMIGTIVMALAGTCLLAIALQLTGAATAVDGLVVATILAGIICAVTATNFFFDGRGFKLYLLTVGFHVIVYLINGTLIAAWQ